MLILLTNDDGIYAPGLVALERELSQMGEVRVVAPATEQSGVGHSITYLTPLTVREVSLGNRYKGWAVHGTPADCVKIGISEFCPRRPDLVVSGINSGLNVGTNVLYSGTVAAAIEGAFFGITSMAVSLEFDDHARYDIAALVARKVIQRVLQNRGSESRLFSLNIPTIATTGTPQIRVVPMDLAGHDEEYERRTDPVGRPYYWLAGRPARVDGQGETDRSAVRKGFVALTPLEYDMTRRAGLAEIEPWQLDLDDLDDIVQTEDHKGAKAAG